MDIHQIAKAHWTDSRIGPAVARLVEAVLDALPLETPSLSTTRLVYALLPRADGVQSKAIMAALQTARTQGLLDGYFDRGKNGPFGKPLVIWHASVAPIRVERSLKEKQDMQDLMFGTNEFGNNPELKTKDF